MELQRGVCGDLAPATYLTDAVRNAGVDIHAQSLVEAARRYGVTVVHCTFSILPDGEGARLDLPVMAAAANHPTLLRTGDPSTELLDGLGPAPDDIVSERHHGLTPFTGTLLAETLQERRITTVVACGVSLNIGIPGLVFEAVGEGFDVTVATDAVVGVPASFGDEVLRNSLAYVATLATTADIIAGWHKPHTA
jgi:nicotinamidase-related amidase